MLQNAYLLAKIGADTAENNRNLAESLPKIGNYPSRSTTRAPRFKRAQRRRGGRAHEKPERGGHPPVEAARQVRERLEPRFGLTLSSYGFLST